MHLTGVASVVFLNDIWVQVHYMNADMLILFQTGVITHFITRFTCEDYQLYSL